MGFADLKNDLGGALANAGALLGIGGNLPYPAELNRVTNVIDVNDKSWQKSLGYSFKVVRVKGGNKPKPADFNGSSWKQFFLQINPQELVQDEIFAIEVTPTFSGVFVEHQGITLKDIRISGTTGLSPKRRGTSGSFPQTGAPVSGSGRSGYVEFHELRNYIRTYVEAKRIDQDKAKGELRLIWTNFRDHESLFVEPQRFTMKRSKDKPHLYDYDIQLKAIGIADFEPKSDGPFELLDAVLETINDVMTSGVKLLEAASDVLERVESEFRSTIINPALIIRDGLRAHQALGRAPRLIDLIFLRGIVSRSFKEVTLSGLNGVNSITETTASDIDVAVPTEQTVRNQFAIVSFDQFILQRDFVKNLRDKIVTVSDNLNDFLSRDTSAFNELKRRNATFIQVLARQSTNKEFTCLNGLNILKKSLNHIIKQKDLFEEFTGVKTDKINQTYLEARSQKIIASILSQKATMETALASAKEQGDIARVGQIEAQLSQLALEAKAINKKPIAFKPVTLSKQARSTSVVGSDTIQTIAARELGDVDRWKELVILNNLVEPYIDTSEGAAPITGVLQAGQTLFIPLAGGSEVVSNINESFLTPITKNLTEAEKKLGVDIQLDKDFDIKISPINDIELVASTENVGQALTLKLLFSPGDLQRHPEIGTDLDIGIKAVNIQQIPNQIRNSLLTDPRVVSVIFVEVIQKSNTIRINMILSLVGLSQPVPISVEV